MKAIKKVSTTPVQQNQGQIIDSFQTTDDKHTNAPSLNIVENRFTSVEGDVSTLNTGVANLGTNKQNKALYGTTEPASSLGNNGDIYFQYNA